MKVRTIVVDQHIHETALLKVSGYPLDLAISYARKKSFIGLFVIALLALKPVFIAGKSPDPYLRLAGLVIFLLATYAGLALALDRTIIRAVRKRLMVRHRPLPLLRGVELNSGDIKLFHCDERRVRAAHYYRLDAELLDGRRVKLLSPVLDAADAQYVLTALRRWLEAAGGLP